MRIILADHHAVPRWALKTLFDELPEFDLIGEAVDAQDLLALTEKHSADLILLDSKLPGISTNVLIARLHALEPRPVVIAMSSETERSLALLKAGADAFVSKGDEPDWLLEKLHQYARQVDMKEAANRKKKL